MDEDVTIAPLPKLPREPSGSRPALQRTGFDWTGEAVAMLRRLAAEGYSATAIALALGGGLTRSAIIGKAHRMVPPIRLHGAVPAAEHLQTLPARVQRAASKAPERPQKPHQIRKAPLTMVAQRAAAPARAEALASAYRASDARRHAFDPAHAPMGARIVPLVELAAGQCKWPLFEDGPMLFCGCAVSGLDRKGRPHSYCRHHQAMNAAVPG